MANTITMTWESSKSTAIIAGVVFLIIWLLAFIDNPIVWPVGVFLTNRAHDLVHILSGLALLVSGFMDEILALRAIQTIGIIYGLVAILGLIMGSGMLLWFIEINMWDNLLHVILAGALLFLGFVVLNKK